MERTLSNRRRYLTAKELEKLLKAGRNGRYGRRELIAESSLVRQVESAMLAGIAATLSIYGDVF